MKTDLELLTLAAKAIGLVGEAQDDYYLHHGDKDPICAFGCDDGECWSPLHDDGDAFRLAVKLNICTLLPSRDSSVRQVGAGEVGSTGPAFFETYAPDPVAAMRRAIVRAAAQIGEAMP